jgi:hypothetical protein
MKKFIIHIKYNVLKNFPAFSAGMTGVLSHLGGCHPGRECEDPEYREVTAGHDLSMRKS